MTTSEALTVLREVAVGLGIPAAGDITLETNLRHDLGVDSVDLLDLLYELDRRCGVALTLEEIHQRPDPTRVASLLAALVAASARVSARDEEPRR